MLEKLVLGFLYCYFTVIRLGVHGWQRGIKLTKYPTTISRRHTNGARTGLYLKATQDLLKIKSSKNFQYRKELYFEFCNHKTLTL